VKKNKKPVVRTNSAIKREIRLLHSQISGRTSAESSLVAVTFGVLHGMRWAHGVRGTQSPSEYAKWLSKTLETTNFVIEGLQNRR